MFAIARKLVSGSAVAASLGLAAFGCVQLEQASHGDDADTATDDAAGPTDSGPSGDSGPADSSAVPGDGDADGDADADGSTSAADGEPTTSSDDGGPPPVCGNGRMEAGEACDDGNVDETDDCTTLCEPPRCDDGLLSGDETDVDCGGPGCDPCAAGGVCVGTTDCARALLCREQTGTCQRPASCHDHLLIDPNATSGRYDIEPTGDGAIEVFCEMTDNGGGWTEVVNFDFANGGDGWSPGFYFTCGGFDVLGYIDGLTDVVRQVDLLSVPHGEAWLMVDAVMIDNWESGESVYVQIDGLQVSTVAFPNAALVNDQCNGPAPDHFAQMSATVVHRGNDLGLTIGSTLNKVIADEALGVDNVRLLVR